MRVTSVESDGRANELRTSSEMKTINAWLEVDSESLPDCISSMVFTGKNSVDGWQLIAVTDDHQVGQQSAVSPTSPRTALVRFELPDRMKCVSSRNPDRIISLADHFRMTSSASDQSVTKVWVSGLPAILASEVVFSDEMTAKGFESNLRRLLPGRGEWLHFSVTSGQSREQIVDGLNRDSPNGINTRPSVTRYERLAAAVATAIAFGRTDIGSEKTLTFDIGTVALLRQLISGNPALPDRKTIISDSKTLTKHLFQAARDHKLKPGSLPRDFPAVETVGLELASILHDYCKLAQINTGVTGMLLPSNPAELPDRSESPDQWASRHILQSLLDLDRFPGIDDILKILETIIEILESESPGTDDERKMALEALQMMMANVETPDDRIDRFRERFDCLPGITGAGHVFWGWSDNPLRNFEHRTVPLKATSPRTLQMANMMFAAAGGAGRQSPRFLRKRLWTAAYRTAWEFLLTYDSTTPPEVDANTLWASEKGDLSFNDSGPLIEIRVGRCAVPLGMQVADQLLLAQTIARRLLQSEALAGTTADAILAAADGDLSGFSKDLKNLIDVTLTVRLGKHGEGNFAGSNVVFPKVKLSDLAFDYRWSDPVSAARKLAEGKTLERILESLIKPRLEKLANQLAEWSNRPAP